MTDNEIIKALEHCKRPTGKHDCENCPYVLSRGTCTTNMLNDTIDLLNRQKAEIEMWKGRITSTCSETLKTMEKAGANLQEFYDPQIIGIQKRVVEASARASEEIERLKIRNDELNALNKTASIEAIREFAERYEKEAVKLLTSATLDKKDGIYACLDILKEMVGDE